MPWAPCGSLRGFLGSLRALTALGACLVARWGFGGPWSGSGDHWVALVALGGPLGRLWRLGMSSEALWNARGLL